MSTRPILQHSAAPLFVALIALAQCLAANSAASAADEARRPNFIIFIADDMAVDDCGAYGHPSIRTPNLDRLAQEGMRFDRAFLTCSSCSPSRSSILTGRYPHSTGAEQLHWPLPAEQHLVTEALRPAGYWTAAIGKWHLGNNVADRFDVVNAKLNDWQSILEARPEEQPYFVWFAFTDPHRPYQRNTIPKPHTAADARVPPYLPDVPETRDDLAMYYDEIGRLDGVVGDVLHWLKETQQADHTCVMFLSDNGRPFPRCKTTVYDSGIQTPLIVSYPGHVKPGQVSGSLVSSIDIMPTVLELAGIPAPESFQGLSFSPLLADPATSVREFVFAEHNWHDYSGYDRAVRNGRFKYVRNGYVELNLSPPADAVRSPTYLAMRQLRDAGKLTPDQQQCFSVPRPAEELYDLESDPDELVNLAADPAHAETLAMLRTALDEWQVATADAEPRVRTPDEFDRETGDKLPGWNGAREPKEGQHATRE